MTSHFMNVLDHDNGLTYEVEYETEGDGSGPSYSPRFGADSGDPLIIMVLSAWHEEYGPVTFNTEQEELVAAFICENHVFDDFDDP